MQRWHTVSEDAEAVLPAQEHLSSNTARTHAGSPDAPPAVTRHAAHRETPAHSLLNVEASQASSSSLRSLPQLREELEQSHQGFHAGASVVSDTLRSSSSARIKSSCRPPHLQTSLYFPTPVHQEKHSPLDIKPVTLFEVNPSFLVHPHVMPCFNPAWPVLVPRVSPNVLSSASVPRHKPFCPVYSSAQLKVSVPCKASFRAPAAREEPSPVFGPHLKVLPAHHADSSGGIAPGVQGSFRRWQRLCETARLFCSARSDAEALACFFISVIPSPDLRLSSAVNAAALEWRNTSDSQRQQYYNTAKMFIEMEEQDKNATRADGNDKGRSLQHSSGKMKKTGKRCKKELPLQDLAESALTEYSQVMDALESKVTDGSEVTDEEDVCALFLNQLLNDSESMTEAGFDMDYINSLLSSDQNISDVFKDNPEPVAGCSDWTHTKSLPPSFVQRDLSSFNGTNLLLSEDPMMENILAPFQDNVKDQHVFHMFTEPLQANPELQSSQTDLHASVQETLQDFGPEADGSQKHETLYVDELDSATQSNCFSLQNYKSHHASFPHTVMHDPEPPETLVDGGLENDGEENMVDGPKTEKYMNEGSAKGNSKIDSDIPNDSQRTRNVCNKQTNLKESAKSDQIEENNANKNKKHRRRKIALPVARTPPKLDDKDVKTAKYQPGKTQRKSANPTKHEAREQETDLIKINVKRVELQNRSEATSSRRANLWQQIRKIRGEHLDDEFERRQRLVRRGGKQRMTKTERDGGKTHRCAEGGRPKKQGNMSVEEDCGDFHHETEARRRLRRETRPKVDAQATNVSEKMDEMST